MSNSVAALIAQRALAQLGTPFRLHGRVPNVALDCVGLVAVATGTRAPTSDYSLRGTKLGTIKSYMDGLGWRSLACDSKPADGDIATVTCASDQPHLMVRADKGWVHSHAGLRKVVHTPDPSPWPIMALRRPSGD